MVESVSLETRIGNLRNKIAANRDYNDLEALRDQDRQIRQASVDLLTAAIEAVESALSRAANERNFNQVTIIEAAAQKLRYVRDRLKSMDYGYAGLFAATPIGAEQLKQLQTYDAALSGQLESVATASSALQASDDSPETIESASRQIVKDADQFLAGLAERSRVIPSLPVQALQQDARALLEGNSAASDLLSSVSDLAPGSTLTIGSTNYVIDATIETTKSESPIKLQRLQRDPETWLISAKIGDGHNLLLLTPSISESVPATALKLGYAGPATVKTLTGSSSELPLKLSLWSADETIENFEVTLDWQNYVQRLSGKQISPSMIQIFGLPEQPQS